MKIKKATKLCKLMGNLIALISFSWPILGLADNIRSFTFDSFSQIKSEFEGKEFLLGLWSVDCPPCLVELDMMGKILDLNPELPFVLISTDPIETKEDAIEFLSDFNLHNRESWMFADSFVERLRYNKIQLGMVSCQEAISLTRDMK